MKKTCAICGGSGQISFFQGVSRFLLTVEECPECAGTGQQLGSDNSKKKEPAEPESIRKKEKTDK